MADQTKGDPARNPAVDEPAGAGVAVTDPRAIRVDDDGHSIIPAGKLVAGDWLVGLEAIEGLDYLGDAGGVVEVDPDLTDRPKPSCWPLLRTTTGAFIYGWAGLDEPIATCTHDPRCGTTVKPEERTP